MANPVPNGFGSMEYNEQINDAVEVFFDQQSGEDDEEEETEYEEEEEENDGAEDVIYFVPEESPPRRERSNVVVVDLEEEEEEEEEKREKRRRMEGKGGGGGGELCSSSKNGRSEARGSQWNRSEIDGLFCPICLEAWTTSGEHHVCCLPCGHLYGFSCINKWTRQKGRSGKCPQCNGKYTLKDVRKLFAPQIAAVDEESQKRIRHLEVKCTSLEKKDAEWCKKEADWKTRNAELYLQVNQLTQRTTYLEHLLKDWQNSSSSSHTSTGTQQEQSTSGHNIGSNFCRRGLSCYFELQRELQLDGARLFDVNASRQVLLIVCRLPGMGGTYVLSKISLIPPHESADILLPSCTKAIRDLHTSPFNDNLALFASLGKKLSVLSMESNNVILSYDLPAAAWSCSWDVNSEHYIYAGLQNGMLLAFDMRQTGRPMESMTGLTCNPIHSIHSLFQDSASPGVQTILSASSIGLCEWNFGNGEKRPFLVPETANQGVCISLACCPTSGDIVASYRPRVQMSNETALSQPALTPSPIKEKGIVGTHALLKRMGGQCYQERSFSLANLPDLRLPKSTIIDVNPKHLFASGDEFIGGLVLQELPSLAVVQRLKSQIHTILDVKYKRVLGQGLIGCLSEDKLQLSTTNIS